jgi:protoporphyrinogen oxidase
MKKAIIIGAGPAGLTAAYELLIRNTGITPIIYEQSGDIGGISKTVNYKGNRMDIGGHRFFSKSDRVMNWWLSILPIENTNTTNVSIHYQNKERHLEITDYQTANAATTDKVMLVRNRLSRIYFLKKFFDYPVKMNGTTFSNLGIKKIAAIMVSYTKIKILPAREEKSLEDFFINRFGRVLYETFFKDYTEKVWGKPCSQISAEWGAQRIKELSVSKAIAHAVKSKFKRKDHSLSQKDVETSLIERFLYPKYGPGQMWEEVALRIQEMGGQIIMHHTAKKVTVKNNQVTSAIFTNTSTGETQKVEGDYFFSTMPVKELINGIVGQVPPAIKTIANGLEYRDFITVGILANSLAIKDTATNGLIKDNWIYVQEKEVKLGRIQLFNNWSPNMVADTGTIWLGLEYFCNAGDELWNKSDTEFIQFAIEELQQIGIVKREAVLDHTIVRVEKTYPAYFGTYNQFDQVIQYTDTIENLFLIGRNGMHKYNNSDHSMLTAMTAVDNIVAGIKTKTNIWEINTEMEYHETK